MSSIVRKNIESLEKNLQKCSCCHSYYPKDNMNNFRGKNICDFCISEYYRKTPSTWGSFSFSLDYNLKIFII